MIQHLDNTPPRQRLDAAVAEHPQSVAALLQQWLLAPCQGRLTDSPVHAAAVFLQLPRESAKALLRMLSPGDIKSLIKCERAALNWDDAQVEGAITRFLEQCDEAQQLSQAEQSRLSGLVAEEFGDEAAQLLGLNLDLSHQSQQLQKLKWLDAEVVLQLIADEHPQVQAALLACLPVAQGRELLQLFDSEHSQELLLRLSAMTGLTPLAVEELDYLLGHKLSGIEARINRSFAGERRVADILKGMDERGEARLLAGIKRHNPDQAGHIQDLLVDFDQLLSLSDQELAVLLGWLGDRSLNLLLAGLGSRDAERLKMALPVERQRALQKLPADYASPRDLDRVKQELLDMAKQMAGAGELVLGLEKLTQ